MYDKQYLKTQQKTFIENIKKIHMYWGVFLYRIDTGEYHVGFPSTLVVPNG